MKVAIHFYHHNKGASLLEVLITVVVLAFGLLGLAGLQMKGLSYTSGSNLRALATQQAYDMADRMRANLQGVMNNNYDNITATIPSDPGCSGTGCTPAQMATYDAYRWNTDNSNLLPSGSGTVSGNGFGNAFVITVSWDDSHADPSATTKTFTMNFQP